MSYSTVVDYSVPDISQKTDLTLVYGLSDFWVNMFQDIDKIQDILGATSMQASDIYSRFLQLCTGISLSEVVNTTGVQVKLVQLKSTDVDLTSDSTGLTFNLPEQILSAELIGDRPILPVAKFRQNIHFEISSDGTKITFCDSSVLESMAQKTDQNNVSTYALWFYNAEVDEKLVYKTFGKFIGTPEPTSSTDFFKNYVQGLYFLYTQGPTLDYIRKGMNLAIGIPLARADEQVIDIFKDQESSNYIVATNTQVYLIPYGLPPTVSIGDNLTVSQELAQWVEVTDYIDSGNWWINLYMPPSIIPDLPKGVTDRYIRPGSDLDILMQNYLKTHTFLVKVNVIDFKDQQLYSQISDILLQAKPTYTAPFYIWAVPNVQETVQVGEVFAFNLNSYQYDQIWKYEHRRDNEVNETRAVPTYHRSSCMANISQLLGLNSRLNGLPRITDFGGVITGTVAPQAQLRSMSNFELGWLNAIVGNRQPGGSSRNRSKLALTRGNSYSAGNTVRFDSYGMQRVVLYFSNTSLLKAALNKAGFNFKGTEQTYCVGKPDRWNLGWSVNDSGVHKYSSLISSNFSVLSSKPLGYHYLSHDIPLIEASKVTTISLDQVNPGDYFEFVNVGEVCYACIFVTSNLTAGTPVVVADQDDPVRINYTTPPTRGAAASGSPWYRLRGADATFTLSGLSNSIDTIAIDEAYNQGLMNMTKSYADLDNSPVNILRDGNIKLQHVMDVYGSTADYSERTI